MKPAVDRLVVEHPDALARFGVGVIEHLVAGDGVRVIDTGASGGESAEAEVVRDMLAIVTSVAGCRYGRRSAKTTRLPAAVSAQTRRGDARDGVHATPVAGCEAGGCPDGGGDLHPAAHHTR
jgi:putative resolvase